MKVRSYCKSILFTFFISMQSFSCEYLEDENKYRRGKFNANPNREELFAQHTENSNKLLSDYDKVSNVQATFDQKKLIIKTTMAKFFVHKNPEQYRLSFKKLDKKDKNYKHFKILEKTEALSDILARGLLDKDGNKTINRKLLSDQWNDHKELDEFGQITQDMFSLWFNEALSEHNDGLTKRQAINILDNTVFAKKTLNEQIVNTAIAKKVNQRSPLQLSKNEPDSDFTTPKKRASTLHSPRYSTPRLDIQSRVKKDVSLGDGYFSTINCDEASFDSSHTTPEDLDDNNKPTSSTGSVSDESSSTADFLDNEQEGESDGDNSDKEDDDEDFESISLSNNQAENTSTKPKLTSPDVNIESVSACSSPDSCYKQKDENGENEVNDNQDNWVVTEITSPGWQGSPKAKEQKKVDNSLMSYLFTAGNLLFSQHATI